MIVHVLACDYDGTIADEGRVAPDTAAALERVRASGRKLMLVTGRMLLDLRRVCPEVDDLFDAVVAENGAVLYFPEDREVRLLGAPPERSLVEALRRRGVPFDLGSAIIATTEPHAEPTLSAIREAGVERSLVFNKGALMLLPGGVTKKTGLEAALDAMGLSAHNVVAIGDGENDHAFLGQAEFAVAVADAVPALRERADYVTVEPASRGVIRFIEEHLLTDLDALDHAMQRHRFTLGQRGDGMPVTLSPHRTRLLIVGPSASGKSTVTGLLVERLLDQGRSICVFDPEGDYQSLSELEGVVVLGAKVERALPSGDELAQLLRRPRSGLVLNLSALSRAEKVDYAAQALASVAAVQATNGLPHWLIIDEAHHVVPREGSPVSALLQRSQESIGLITLTVDDLDREVRGLPNALTATDLDAFNAALGALLSVDAGSRAVPRLEGPALRRGEAAMVLLGDHPSRPVRFQVDRRRVEHQRHVRKYVDGELPPDRSFYFKGPTAALNLRAVNLARFCELAEGVDEPTWRHHLERREYSTWMREMIKDSDLAAEVDAIESHPDRGASRAAVLAAIRRRYAI